MADPFMSGGRMYRTGDVVRRTAAGELEFLGRADFQVKLRGYRIELGEIESAIERLPGIRQAVVVVREDRPGDRRLAAYVVPSDPARVSSEEIRDALSTTLPEYMVPSHFVVLDRLPLTPNKKVDRGALPPPLASAAFGGSAAGSEGGGGPSDELERLIEEVWTAALGVLHVDRDKNVFDLGATSLMMPEVQVELRRRSGREISLIDLFEHPTVSALAAWLVGVSKVSRVSDRAQRRRAARERGPAR
jgi:hypothetical protein